ncbi:hypothetical protein M422DRAFT_784790 [Sphaerobolus stellatus SS14]|uniref:Uncharacterized protein n=1 Tax=Sphaerobolus stellatus (strain SS14) TaxID=990650 RepID=A0A0C9UQT4_SPHS4|nr:hypothetical protein M422DRAFT_784790 [Sphaerobolus stellatus SS14]
MIVEEAGEDEGEYGRHDTGGEACEHADKERVRWMEELRMLSRDGSVPPGPVDTTAGGLMAAVGHCGLVGFEVIVVLHDGVDALRGELEAGAPLALGHMGLGGDSGGENDGGEWRWRKVGRSSSTRSGSSVYSRSAEGFFVNSAMASNIHVPAISLIDMPIVRQAEFR